MMMTDDYYPKVNEEVFALLPLMMKILRINQEEYMTEMNDHDLYAVMIFDNDE